MNKTQCDATTVNPFHCRYILRIETGRTVRTQAAEDRWFDIANAAIEWCQNSYESEHWDWTFKGPGNGGHYYSTSEEIVRDYYVDFYFDDRSFCRRLEVWLDFHGLTYSCRSGYTSV